MAENADQQQKKEFLNELELMKPMAPHPNIVGLVGCCTKSSKWSVFSSLNERTTDRERHSGLIASTLDSGLSSPGSSPG